MSMLLEGADWRTPVQTRRLMVAGGRADEHLGCTPAPGLNALFAGSNGGADRWAIVASLIETCKLNGVEPYAWLRDVLTTLIAGHANAKLDQLLPYEAPLRHDTT